MAKDKEGELPVRGFRLRTVIWEALKNDADARGMTILAALENILAAYYGMDDLFVEPKNIKRAKELLESAGYRVTRDDFEEAKPSGKEKRE
jgi:hypothetical protein